MIYREIQFRKIVLTRHHSKVLQLLKLRIMQTYGRPISLSIYTGVEVVLDSRIIFSKEKRQEPLTFA